MIEYTPTVVTLSLVVVVSLAISLMYLVRVLRNKKDTLRWALLGLLATLAITNFPPLMAYLGSPMPQIVGEIARIVAALILIWASWPLLRDSYHEVKACLAHCDVTSHHRRSKKKAQK